MAAAKAECLARYVATGDETAAYTSHPEQCRLSADQSDAALRFLKDALGSEITVL